MTDYLRFRELLVSRGVVYVFDDEAESYEIYDQHRSHIVSIPSRIARRDVSAARDLIDTGLSLYTLFES